MTISSTNRKAGPYSGTGAQTAFPFTFKVFATSDVLVVQTDSAGVETTLSTGYSVALNADQDANPGGVVNLVAAPPVGALLTIGSAVPATQGQSIPNMGGFYPKVIEKALDKLTVIVQQVAGLAGRSLKFPFSDTVVADLPTAAQRANNLLAFDASGNPIAIAPAAQSATALQLLLATPIGASLIGFIQAGLGAIARAMQDKGRESVSIADYGARLDGSDDIAAIDKAIAAMSLVGGGTVRLGRGVIGISRMIKLKRGVILAGEGGFDYSAYPTIKGSTIKPLVGYSDGFVVMADSGDDNTKLLSGLGLTDLAIDMTNISALGARAVALRSVSNFGPVRNIVVYNMDHGIGLELDQTSVVASPNATDGVDVVNFFTYGKTVGYVSVLPRLQVTNNVNEINFRGCKWQSKSNAAAGTIAARIFSGGRGITFDGDSFAGCETGLIIIANSNTNSPPEWVRVSNCTFEGYRVGIYADSLFADPNFYPRRLYVDRSNRFITATGANCRKVLAGKVNDCYFAADEWIEAGTSGTSKLVELTADAIGCVIEASPDSVINASATSIVLGRKDGYLKASLYLEPVTAVTPVNGWVNSSPANRPTAGYYKDPAGICRPEGCLTGGTYGSGAGNIMYSLPVGYRPLKSTLFTVATEPAGKATILITNAGDIYPLAGDPGAVCLNGISFRTA